jgi:hypothetical protein
VANWFTRIFTVIKRGLNAFLEAARRRGLTDALAERALEIVIAASQIDGDASARFDYAVAELRKLFPTIRLSIARLAIELAYQAWMDSQPREPKVEF